MSGPMMPPRQMFVIDLEKHRICVPAPGCPLNPRDYMVTQKILTGRTDQHFQEVIHGEVHHGVMHAYQGDNFTMPERSVELINALRNIQDNLKLPRAPIAFGVMHGRPHRPDTHAPMARRMELLYWDVWK